MVAGHEHLPDVQGPVRGGERASAAPRSEPPPAGAEPVGAELLCAARNTQIVPVDPLDELFGEEEEDKQQPPQRPQPRPRSRRAAGRARRIQPPPGAATALQVGHRDQQQPDEEYESSEEEEEEEGEGSSLAELSTSAVTDSDDDEYDPGGGDVHDEEDMQAALDMQGVDDAVERRARQVAWRLPAPAAGGGAVDMREELEALMMDDETALAAAGALLPTCTSHGDAAKAPKAVPQRSDRLTLVCAVGADRVDPTGADGHGVLRRGLPSRDHTPCFAVIQFPDGSLVCGWA